MLCEDETQLSKLESLGLDHAWTFADLDELRARGREHAVEQPNAVLDAAAKVDEDDLFTYIYTSGTTGPPKGCMIRHRNYYEMVAVVDQLERLTVADDLLLLYLPLAHNFGRLMHLAGPYVGYTIAFLPDPLRTADALLQVRPTVLPSVPRVYEKVHAGVLAKFDEETGAKRRIVDWALGVGRRVSTARQRGAQIPMSLELRRRLAHKLVYSKVQARLGGRLRIAISGGAPLAREIAEFFDALGITILEGYGLTECTSAATVNRVEQVPARHSRPGPTWNRATPGRGRRAVHPEPDGLRGLPQGRDGDARGARRRRLAELGRHRRDRRATASSRSPIARRTSSSRPAARTSAPANIENDLKVHREISQALVIGDRRPFVAALVTLDPDATAGLTDEQKQQRIQEIVDDVNRERSRYEQIKRFVILPRDFSMEEDEVTPTLKLKRSVVARALRARGRVDLFLENPAGADEARRVGTAERRDLHDVAGVRGVDEVPAADVDPDVTEPVEEDEVAGLEIAHRDRHAGAVLRVARVRQRDAHLRVDVHRRARSSRSRTATRLPRRTDLPDTASRSRPRLNSARTAARRSEWT